MKKATSIEEIESSIANDMLVLLYLSQPECSVCQSLLPRVDELISNYPGVKAWYVNMAEIPLAAGRFGVFTIPTVLLFADRRENMRLVRNFGLIEIREKLDRICELIKPDAEAEV